jgi:hypothetical protein
MLMNGLELRKKLTKSGDPNGDLCCCKEDLFLIEKRENKQIYGVHANKTHQECRMGLGVSNKK